MTTIETPPPAAPEPAPTPRRSGFYVAPWILAVLGGLVLLVIGFVVGRAVDHGDHNRGRFFRGGDPGGHPGLRLLIVLVVIALVVVAVVALVRHFSHRDAVAAAATPPVAPSTSATAEQVLADRFARGEIDEAEFVSRRNALRS
jgi:putative membrane protein